tara:strand:- start:449 stop:1897 length:1449 start_codon:yes stop_codon:yes gene_type:complete
MQTSQFNNLENGPVLNFYEPVFNKIRKSHYVRRKNFCISSRIALLDKLRNMIKQNESKIIQACAADFGKPSSEVMLTEILPVLQEIKHTKRHLRDWARPKRAKASLGVFGTKSYVRPEPKGICLIISPWNYPFNLAVGPLVSAIAAGNGVIIKPSEMTPNTSELIASIISKCFPSDLVAVVQGDTLTAKGLVSLPFDHIFFTGSSLVGKLVMEAAAKNLTSVTLELGGKSPTIVGPKANIKKSVRNIVWGKYTNNGQTCIAPDHLYIHVDIAEEFTNCLRNEIKRVYGKTVTKQKSSPDYCRIVSLSHFKRITNLLKDAESKGARIIQGGESDENTRFIAPTIILNPSDNMQIMQEELFGPLLPVIEFKDIDLVIEKINANPKPLALYVFDERKSFVSKIIDRTSSGAVGVNLTVTHFLHPKLPFGGVNNSGIGAAHGEYGFKEFSHFKSTMENHHSITHMLFPPYNLRVRTLISSLIRILG